MLIPSLHFFIGPLILARCPAVQGIKMADFLQSSTGQPYDCRENQSQVPRSAIEPFPRSAALTMNPSLSPKLWLTIPSPTPLNIRMYTTLTPQTMRPRQQPTLSRANKDVPKASDANSLPKLSHITGAGTAHMVTIGDKPDTARSASATARVIFSSPATYRALATSSLSKGDAFAVARVAAIMAAKRCPDLIALAHSGLRLTGVKVDIELLEPIHSLNLEPTSHKENSSKPKHGGVHIVVDVQCHGPTGVEMEAVTAASVAALNVYDMCKAVDKAMLIEGVRVVSKSGGKSGDWSWDEENDKIVKR